MVELIIGICALGIVTGYRRIKNSRKLSRETKWHRLAKQLGLSFTEGPRSDRELDGESYLPEMFGNVDGTEVYVGVRSFIEAEMAAKSMRLAKSHREYFTLIEVFFDEPLKRGLQMKSAGTASQFFANVLGGGDMTIDNRPVDKAYKIRGHEREQIKLLLKGVEPVENRLGFKSVITDERIMFVNEDVFLDQELEGIVRHAAKLKRAVEKNWHSLPPSATELKIDPAWSSVSKSRNMAYDHRSMKIGNESEGFSLSAEVEWRVEGWHTNFNVSFDIPLQLNLVVEEMKITDRIAGAIFGDAIKVGHQEFDKSFVVTGKEHSRIKQVFTPETCDGILQIFQAVGGEVSDVGIFSSVRGVVTDPEQLDSILTLFLETGKAMLAHRKVDATHGPYR